jgi:anti-sigma factor RsiW
MNCEQARQLFDAYLDGELPPSLATELGAHRVSCPECRQALALLEVTGHIIASDSEPVSLRDDFSERLLECMDTKTSRWPARMRRILYISGPLAAAAVIALAFLGVFDRHDTKVASEKTQAVTPPSVVEAGADRATNAIDEAELEAIDDADRALEEWAERTQENLNTKLESGERLREYFDLTIFQWLDIVNSAQDAPGGEDHFPGADIQLQPDADKAAPTDDDTVEDL